MTDNKNSGADGADEEEFQASSEDIEIKPWDLPYWKGGPKKTKEELAQERINKRNGIETLEPLTVESIEKIRADAYEEGFLQGLNEGRDKGEADGHAEGLAAGKRDGFEVGKKEGHFAGFEAGEEEGLASGKQEIADAAVQLRLLIKQLEQSLVEKDSAIPQVLSQLIQSACVSVLERELEQGDDQITQKVVRALDELPGGADNIKVFISPKDAEHLQQGLVSAGYEVQFAEDASLESGSARITTKQSLLEFSHKERMDKIFEVIDQECEKLDVSSEYVEPEPEPEPEDDVESDQEDIL
jgi:flagellar assembly protein FliH